MRNRYLGPVLALAVLLAAPPAWAQAGTTWTTEIDGDVSTAATELTLQLKPGAAPVLYWEPAGVGLSPGMTTGGSCGSVVFETFGATTAVVYACSSGSCVMLQTSSFLVLAAADRESSVSAVRHFQLLVGIGGGLVKATCSPGSS